MANVKLHRCSYTFLHVYADASGAPNALDERGSPGLLDLHRQMLAF
ncbi:MAG: hypothetical protein JOZ07_12085 [Solirubrobacterales bacterium]|nr:hypothetical protein [Solirubrobacterales bacterium]